MYASDGLWSVMTDQDVVDEVMKAMEQVSWLGGYLRGWLVEPHGLAWSIKVCVRCSAARLPMVPVTT